MVTEAERFLAVPKKHGMGLEMPTVLSRSQQRKKRRRAVHSDRSSLRCAIKHPRSPLKVLFIIYIFFCMREVQGVYFSQRSKLELVFRASFLLLLLFFKIDSKNSLWKPHLNSGIKLFLIREDTVYTSGLC